MGYRMRIVLCALLLSGCASGEVVELRRGDGMSARCGPYRVSGIGPDPEFVAAMQLRGCVEDYQRAGYERAAAVAH